jgi:predicted DsbA family dithiol-disulfide isomerase
LKVAEDAEIRGTPTFFINGERLVGVRGTEFFRGKIEAALAKVKTSHQSPAELAAAAAARPIEGDGRPGFGIAAAWPPVPVTLPDHMLGPRIKGHFALGNAPVRGNPKAAVEVVYITPLAKLQGRQTLDGLLATYGESVRVVAKVMPFAVPPPEPTTLVAEAALYAHAQGKFWAFHDNFNQDFPRPGRARVFEVARQIGLDEADLAAALESGRFRAAVLEDAPAFEEAGIHDYAFVVDGRLASGSTAAAQLIEDAIRKTGHEPPPRPGPAPKPSPGHVPDSDGLLATMSPRQIFALEPRDDAWAAAVEEQLAPIVERDLRVVEPKLRDTGIDCRTSMCRVRWQLETRAMRGCSGSTPWRFTAATPSRWSAISTSTFWSCAVRVKPRLTMASRASRPGARP